MVQVLVPTFVLPEYVSQVIVQVPDVALGICEHKLMGGVHDTEAEDVFVAMVPVALPNLYVRVWVNALLALLIVIV
jgi:hypothetical protein